VISATAILAVPALLNIVTNAVLRVRYPVPGALHQLLKQAGEKRPFVMVAASVAGFYARQYVDRFPSEVAGLVLVDSSSPEQLQAIPGSGYSEELIKRKHREVMKEWWKEASGLALLTGDCKAEVALKDIEVLLAPRRVGRRTRLVGAEKLTSFGIPPGRQHAPAAVTICRYSLFRKTLTTLEVLSRRRSGRSGIRCKKDLKLSLLIVAELSRAAAATPL
jgi:pimeloyl-ACP methyl ester carboxylesterase